MSTHKQSPAPVQNEHPDGNHTADNSALIDPYDVMFNIGCDQIMMNSALLAREQELIAREQELLRTTIRANNELFDRLLTMLEKRVGIR